MPQPLDRQRQRNRQITRQPPTKKRRGKRHTDHGHTAELSGAKAHPVTVKPDLSWPTVERIHISTMKRHLLENARRTVQSGRVAQSASTLPARTCFAQREHLNGSLSVAPRCRDDIARHCSPPTPGMNENVNISKLIAWPSMRRGRLSVMATKDYNQTLETGILLVYRHNHLGATAPAQGLEPKSEARPNIAATVNRHYRPYCMFRRTACALWPEPPPCLSR